MFGWVKTGNNGDSMHFVGSVCVVKLNVKRFYIYVKCRRSFKLASLIIELFIYVFSVFAVYYTDETFLFLAFFDYYLYVDLKIAL